MKPKPKAISILIIFMLMLTSCGEVTIQSLKDNLISEDSLYTTESGTNSISNSISELSVDERSVDINPNQELTLLEESSEVLDAKQNIDSAENNTYEDTKSTDSSLEKALSNFVLGFSDNETTNLRNLAKKLGIYLKEKDAESIEKIPSKNLEAIAVFENSDSYGWIIKYDDNKIGVASISHEQKQPVVEITGESRIFSSGASGIVDNDPDMFKEKCQEIVKDFLPEGTTVRFLCD